jgi:hypothetical protein
MMGRPMPDSRKVHTLLAAIAVFAACSTFAPPTNVLVTRTPTGDKAVPEEGTSAHLSRWDIGFAREGLKRGFFVVKSDLEWRQLWPSTDPDKVPLVPFDLDFAREMLLVSSPSGSDATASEVKSVILTDRAVHVYVTQTVLGTDCPESPDTVAKNYDLVRTLRVDDKEVHYHVDTVMGDACGKPPEAGVTCKPDRSNTALVDNLSVEPGTKVVCVASELKASRPLFDFTWVWDALPIGSSAKIDVAKGGRGVTFVPDVIGTYRIALEVSDDLARKGKVTGAVEVPPPPGPLSLQMAWTKVEANDDPATFPRVELHVFGLVSEALAAAKARGVDRPTVAWSVVKSCALTVPLSWCTPKAAGATTLMALDPTWAPELAVAVRYVDERVPGQPILCVRSYRDGKMRAERCDPDKRSADSLWEVGVFDSLTGKTPEMLAQEKAATAARAAADAGPPKDAGPAGPARAPDASVAAKP